MRAAIVSCPGRPAGSSGPDLVPLFLSGQVGDQVRSWPLEAETVIIGRSSRCAIQLPNGTVSKEHAEIIRRGDEWFIRDLGSRNGTRVNGLEAAEPLPLRPGDRVEIGQALLQALREDVATPVSFNDATVMGSSLKLRADQILERQSRGSGSAVRLVHLLAEAGRLLVRPQSLAETCDELLSFVEKAVQASRYVLLLQKDAGSEPQQIAARTRGGRANEPLVLSRSIMKTVMDECTSVLTADATQDPRFQGQHSIVAQAVRSAMAVPLFDNQTVLGVLYVDTRDPSITFAEDQLELLTLIANMAAVKITNARLIEADSARARLAQELATAAQIQRGLLPLSPPAVTGWQFDAYLESCHEVGGDLYDFHRTSDGRMIFLLGDVSGKGMGASLLMSSFLASARVLYDANRDLVELAGRLGQLLFASTDSGRFITGFLGSLELATGELTYVNAGHPPACLVRGKELHELKSTGVPFGILPSFVYESDRVTLQSEDLLAIFSDGIPEAQSGEEFFDQERVEAVMLEQAPVGNLEVARKNILERVREFVGESPRTDDITLLLVRRGPKPEEITL
jgi:sigma-B regulation protein RsbU (phosphoserine phosphatase)